MTMTTDPGEKQVRWLRVAVVSAVVIGLLWWSKDLRWDVVWANRHLLILGFGRTIVYAISSMALGLVAGVILATARVYGPFGIRHAAVAIIEIVRGMPQLMVIFWIFFAIPEVTGEAPDGSLAALLALTAIAAAYLAEDTRAGFTSVHRVQWESGYSAGLTSLQIFLHVILPQAIRNMLPAILATGVTMIKVTSLIYVVGVIDMFRAAILINNRVFEPYALYLVIAVVYFVLCYALTYFVRRLDPKYTLVS